MGKLHPLKVKSLLNKYKLTDNEITLFENAIEINDKIEGVALMVNTIYHSSNIEYEDELTVEDTRVIVKDIIAKRKHSMNNDNKVYIELLVNNMYRAYENINNIIQNKYLKIEDIKDTHYLMTEGLPTVITPGLFRNFEATIASREDTVNFTPPHLIKEELDKLIADINALLYELEYDIYNTNMAKLNKILDIKRRFISIHPFEDGNGRMSRLLFQYLLLKAKLPMACFKTWNRKDYHNGMHIAHTCKGNTSIMKSMYIKEILDHSREEWFSKI